MQLWKHSAAVRNLLRALLRSDGRDGWTERSMCTHVRTMCTHMTHVHAPLPTMRSYLCMHAIHTMHARYAYYACTALGAVRASLEFPPKQEMLCKRCMCVCGSASECVQSEWLRLWFVSCKIVFVFVCVCLGLPLKFLL